MTISNTKSFRYLGLTLGLAITPAISCLTATAFAGPGVGHTHSTQPLSKDEILESSKKVRDKLITDGKVESSWKDISPESAEQKDFGQKKEWVVTFKNPKATDKTKESLYLFFSLPGNFLAANYTGK